MQTLTNEQLDQRPAPEPSGGEAEHLDPSALVDVWTESIPMRLSLLRAIVPHLEDNGPEMAEALAELSQMGTRLVAASADESVRPSGLVERLRKLARRLGQVEELVLRSVFRAVKSAEERGEVQ